MPPVNSTFKADDSVNGETQKEFVEPVRPAYTHLDRDDIDRLSPEHREYLLARHGTLDLDPVPDMSDADPYNWPHRKKVVNLMIVAFHAMMATFTAASIQSAFENIAADLGCSLQRASYLTSLQIAILGGAPLFWKPLSDRYGRRPVFIVSLICSMVANIGCSESHSYGSMAASRAIVAFFISPAAAIGSAVVAETFFKQSRARYMGIWTVMVTIGVPISPFIFGFLAYRVDYRWIYRVLAITNAVQLIVYLFLGPETRYLRHGVRHEGSAFKQEYMQLRRIDPTPLRFRDFVQPLRYFARPSVVVPAVAYAMVFLFASVMLTVEVPQLFGPAFKFNTQQMGLQYISMIIGSLLGEQIGGFTSDAWMNRRTKKIGTKPAPEWRLWLSYSGYILSIVGVIVFLVQLGEIGDNYNVTPLVGAAIASGGNQIVTTVLITYAVDCYREDAASVGVFITFVRQMWGFIGPFWFPQMFTNVGLYGSAGIITALVIVFSLIPTIILQWKGSAWRSSHIA
ncbi:major facilitator superfamily domain-containing protein [Exophiala viscosa]|uniref:Major facilitator superfamily domain-containing protein n=1 Tax=Exophiala viscosa TaxID=2486360 RepID=A0AAN6E2C6_9EURO|nr:major facilitator superfamily domain-containing protein [Exophiala viscosa]